MDKSAYELADKLQELDSKLHLINLFKSADMLRQQADRIAELEKQLQTKDAIDSTMPYIESWNKLFQQQGTPQLQQATPQTNAEPVAWINENCLTYAEFIEDGITDTTLYRNEDKTTYRNYKLIPLYTTPQTKLLSDEEILDVWVSSNYIKFFEDGQINEILFNKFARAIEERILGK